MAAASSQTPGGAGIEIAAYDPRWPARFEAERSLLNSVLVDWLAGAIEHIGSTAVEGMAAKPIIDIMAPVRSLAESTSAIPALEKAGYLHYPYKPDVMHWFCKPSASHRTHHLHLVPMASELWHQRLAFRDALRADATLRQEYVALKRRLATEFGHDREAYTEGKSAFVASVSASFAASSSTPASSSFGKGSQ